MSCYARRYGRPAHQTPPGSDDAVTTSATANPTTGLPRPGAQARYGAPRATYRLQLHTGFDFAKACDVVPYLRGLGISHVYLSPIFAATPGSLHGYDVIDHGRVNPELGGMAGLYAFGEALVANGIGCILDIVPNHVGVEGANPWWQDVLRYGQASRYAAHFDIDWEAQPHLARGVLVVPILGKPFGACLEAGELRVELIDGLPWLRYFDHVLPLAPQTLPGLIGLPPVELGSRLRDPASLPGFIAVLDELRAAEPDAAELLLGRLRSLLESEAELRQSVVEALQRVNGEPGLPASFDTLEEVLRAQHYRLAFWRVSGEELNYRRFFDVNGLAGVRVERDEVFDEVHRLVLDLVAQGIVTGVRVDHIDGLYDPKRYLERLRDKLEEAAAGRGPIPIYVEKILEHGERLPAGWPVNGTTGYEFAAAAEGLFIDAAAEAQLTDCYREFTGNRLRYEDVAYQSQREVTDLAFAGEINVLATQLHRLAQRQRLFRDETLASFRRAIRSVLASFPVYRTYSGDAADDERFIRAAVVEARRREPVISEGATDFLEQVLLLRGELEPDERERREQFRRKFQQVSGPVMAKGVEDTAFFRYPRLLSLNEVGNDPAQFGRSPGEVHAWFGERAQQWPAAMSAGSTHDSKRSHDTRARLHVLSELPREWRREVRAWSRMNARYRAAVDGETAPDPNTEYYLYQTLVGSLPGIGIDDEYRQRVRDHLLKAVREAKVRTSWLRPDERYESICTAFVEAVLGARSGKRFQRRLEAFVRRIRAAGCLNALSGIVLRGLAPGHPDFYQGEECWSLAMTDPDNRRPVDFASLRRLTATTADAPPAELVTDEAKVWTLCKVLGIRARFADLFANGEYRAVAGEGEFDQHLFAFARRAGQDCLVVVVPRIVASLADTATGHIPPSMWQGSAITLPDGHGPWEDLLSGARHTGSRVQCTDLLSALPFAVLRGRRI